MLLVDKPDKMKNKILILFALVSNCFVLHAQNTKNQGLAINPLDLQFHRLAVRRFIFSNNIPLSEFVPAEIVAFSSMHPAFAVSSCDKQASDTSFQPQISQGRLVLNAGCGIGPVSFYVGGVNPYATYEMDIDTIHSDGTGETEIGFELAKMGLRNRVQVVVRSSGTEQGIYVRVYKDGVVEREVKYASSIPKGRFTLRAQLYGHSLGLFTAQNGQTSYQGYVGVKENFAGVLDFREVKTAQACTFNIISNLKGTTVVSGARSYLSAGIGQADIRLISNEDLSPYMDQGRLWFTFSCRGIDIYQSAQGVLSLDPSVFDVRFEGMIVFDHGDGLLRNDYASHLFFDRNAKEWRAYACDFGGTANRDGRSGTGLVLARSVKDPRRGFSVMKAKRIDTASVAGHNEDPCIFYDKRVKKWRLLTSAFVNRTITSRTFESAAWDGKFTPVAPPISMNSTGTSIQKIGKQYYAFMGGLGNLRVHSYPDLKVLGELNLDLQPHWPKPAARVWASIVPLPDGFPYRYVLLTMDRPNFPGIKGANWSYGALYFYGAAPEFASAGYEY
jgi:hypothetical protein